MLVSRGDVPRNDYAPEDDLPDEPKYDKFAYENDKKMWGIDNNFYDDEGADILRSEPRKHRKLYYTSGMKHLYYALLKKAAFTRL